MPTQVVAIPWLVCDDPLPEQEVTDYLLELDAVEHTTGAPLYYDLLGISPGPHEVRGKAINKWGKRSEWSAMFYFDAVVPGVADGLDIIGTVLSCNDVEYATYYLIDVNGTMHNAVPPLDFDLMGLVSIGQNEVKIIAGNAWGESAWSSPFILSVEIPSPPSALDLMDSAQ